jgi:DNA-binding CsgD family transcriptional regulator
MADLPSAGMSLERWCSAANDVAAFSDGLFTRLATAIPFDGAFLAAVDPATLLYTRAFRRDLPAEAGAAFIQTELGVDDVNQLRHLARAPDPVGWLDRSTQGDRMASRRYRLAMRPYGMGDELRVALMLEGSCWGLLCLHRAAALAGFEPRDARLLAAIGPLVAGALRRALVSEQAYASEAWDAPGVAVLNADRTLRMSTAAAARWLDELDDVDRPHTRELPTVVLGVVEQLNACTDGDRGAARARVRAPSGRWLTVQAAPLDDASGSVAVILEPTAAAALAPLIIAAYGLTNRERDVTQRLLAGLARKAIAAELHISPHTVNDHVKAVFDKTGVSSAGQLGAQVFRQVI